MRRALLILPVILLLASSVQAALPTFAAGQVWNYRTRPQDRGSLLRVWRVDPGTAGARTIHISVIGLADRSGRALPEIQHLAIAERALAASVTTRSDSDAVFPDPAPFYAAWKRSKGGVFPSPLGQMIATFVKSIRAR